MSQPPSGRVSDGGPGTEVPTCPRHPDRVSYIRCQRCRRPVCPDCQRSAAVGVQCVDCIREQAKGERPRVTVFGGRAGADRPYLTIAIIAICVLVWLGELASPRVFQEVAFAPFLGTSEPWRLITSAFAHSPYQIMHIGFNMLALWMIGGYLEQMLGWARYLALYLVSALAGAVTWLLFQPAMSTTPLVGASGAVFGLFGALFVLNRHLGRDSSGMVAVIGINAVLGFVIPNVAWQAHLGGLIAGGLLALAIAVSRSRGRPALAWVAIVGVLVIVLALGVAKYAASPAPVPLPFA
ncbi:rhomboid family intramembrane serine protease [Janibacter limosus]|uniref:Rhomboid family intramembrane serine protease n=1 Tax=Janibacter limosus TaxID=53458 RepID=A0A4P6MZN2_9MICO|nr:rhomboid family intramembrane serine protease [Janibacter limosus]QBF47490.1 rhomboid family intramembrane serine protease [Janibacter limosus]